MNDQPHGWQTLYPQGNIPWHPSNWRMCGPQKRSGRFWGTEKYLAPSSTQTPDRPTCSQVTIQTELTRLLATSCRLQILWNNCDRLPSVNEAMVEWWRQGKSDVLTYLLTYSMQQSPSWEANQFSASQEIPPYFMEPESSLPHSQVPATCPYPEPARSSPYTHIPLLEESS